MNLRRKLPQFTIICVSIAAGLLFCEGAVRYLRLAPALFDYTIFGPMMFVENAKICYKMRPSQNYDGATLNREGYKDKDYPVEKGKDVFRIIMLGDSITEGAGIGLGYTFSDQLESLLNEKARSAGSATRYEVMNFGVAGYNIVNELETLRVYGLKYKPDIVILNYFWNDDEPYPYYYGWFMQRSDLSAAEKNLVYHYYLSSDEFKLRRLLLRSHLLRLCWWAINRAQEHDGGAAVPGNAPSNDIVPKKLRELKQWGKQYNFKTVVVMHPVLDYDKRQPHPHYRLTRDAAQGLGFLCVDLLPYYKNVSPNPIAFSLHQQDRIHLNGRGHTLVAKSIVSELEKNHLF